MINFKYALDFEGFKQDVTDKNILNVTFAGVEQPFARYDTKHFQWELQSGVPRSELFYSEISLITSFSGCASAANKIIKDKAIEEEITSGLKIVEEFFLTLKSDHRKFFELKNDLGKEISSMADLLEALYDKGTAPVYMLSQVSEFLRQSKVLVGELRNDGMSFETVSSYYNDN